MYAKIFLFSITIGLCVRLFVGLFFDIYGFRNQTHLELKQSYIEQELHGITEALERIQSFESVVLAEEISSVGILDDSSLIIPKLYEQNRELLQRVPRTEHSQASPQYRRYLQNALWISIVLVYFGLSVLHMREKKLRLREASREHSLEHS